jgi:thioredoxin 1
MAHDVTTSSFQKDVLESDTPVLVDFWAEWCGPCKAVAPILDELAGEYDGKIKIVKLNVDENQEIAEKYGVMSIPTFIAFKDGQQADSFVGALPKESFKKHIEDIIA